MRSRAVSLPRACWASMRSWPPPRRAAARRSATRSGLAGARETPSGDSPSAGGPGIVTGPSSASGGASAPAIAATASGLSGTSESASTSSSGSFPSWGASGTAAGPSSAAEGSAVSVAPSGGAGVAARNGRFAASRASPAGGPSSPRFFDRRRRFQLRSDASTVPPATGAPAGTTSFNASPSAVVARSPSPATGTAACAGFSSRGASPVVSAMSASHYTGERAAVPDGRFVNPPIWLRERRRVG